VTALDDLVAEWTLTPDGPGSAAGMPVRADGAAAFLRVGASEHAHLVLRRWNGDGAVRLLRADPHRRALLLERASSEDLVDRYDVEACEVVASLYPRLHVPAMPQLPSLTTLLTRWADDFGRLPRNAPIPHRLVEQAITLCRELAAEPAEHVLHGNLHYGNVLAADREPWLAISPAPLNGDPAFEIAPMLWHRWDDLADAIRWGVQQRFYALVDAAGFDEDRARAWVIVRVVRAAVDAVRSGVDLTRFVTLAKAVQD
jgi:streptomycin 6-kinase